MGHLQPKSLSELIDTLERIREELFTVQRNLERMEDGETEKHAKSSTSQPEKA